MPDDSQPVAANQDDALVLRQDTGAIARVTLNRPKAYNSLSLEMMRVLTATLQEIGQDQAIRCVVIEGAGKGFCAGHDLKELRSRTDRAFYEEVFETCCQLMSTITRLPQPVIAKVHGIATAAGCQLVATCDLALADDAARLSTPGVNIGLFCSTPMVALSRNVPRKRAMEMLLTGEMVSAPVAAEWGLINQAVDHAGLEAAVMSYAEAVASKSPHVLKIGKRAFYQQLDQSLDEAYRHTAQVMTENMLARDAAEGIDAFLEKREPQWTGE
ncbi:enoyl-CoA hydratase [Rhodovibrio sodomensis]|uniref:Enoyl-CoA hydratase domain-containing protein 3, mitochondrial n=1 Tax=Rhodovibrio sodomensis TaxID=1088 RepID=A0ABS1DG85_9PROT|nr:enoyl-CoA hydratase [Rhodovibrio sodomensis]MBK1669122.1 enoyl-CoA hydratase [Rhodovibrio sodomensis]